MTSENPAFLKEHLAQQKEPAARISFQDDGIHFQPLSAEGRTFLTNIFQDHGFSASRITPDTNPLFPFEDKDTSGIRINKYGKDANTTDFYELNRKLKAHDGGELSYEQLAAIFFSSRKTTDKSAGAHQRG